MDYIPTQDQAVATETPPRRKKHKDDVELERLKKSISGIAAPKTDKKKSEGKKLKKKLYEIEEKNESLSKMIYEKNSEIVELRKSVNSLNEILNSVPIEELRCNSSIASSKLLELSKKNRQLRAELETTKNRLTRKDVQLQKLEKDLKAAEEKSQQELEVNRKATTSPVDELQSKLQSMQQKLFETRNKNVELTNQLKLAHKCLQQEIGENFNLNLLASHATTSNWRGRAQQILHLQQKVQELKDRLDNSEKKNYGCYSNNSMSSSLDLDTLMVKNGTDNLLSATPSVHSIDRPNVRHSELQHRVKVEALDKEIASLKSKLEEQRGKILALKVRNKTLNDEIARHKSKASTLEEQTDFNSINVATMTEKLNQQKLQYEKRMGELTKEIRSLEKQREDMELQEEHMRAKVDDLEACLVGKEESNAELNAVIKKLEADLKAVCGGFLFSCREFRKEEFITILDSLESEKNALMEHNKTLNERLENERFKNENLQELVAKQKVRISRLEAKVREMEREIEVSNDKKKRSQRIAEYTSNLSTMGSTTSLTSFTFENTSVMSGGAGKCGSDEIGDSCNTTELKNRLELANEKIKMLREKLDYITAEKESDIKTFEQIIGNSKNVIIESILAQRESLTSIEVN